MRFPYRLDACETSTKEKFEGIADRERKVEEGGRLVFEFVIKVGVDGKMGEDDDLEEEDEEKEEEDEEEEKEEEEEEEGG